MSDQNEGSSSGNVTSPHVEFRWGNEEALHDAHLVRLIARERRWSGRSNIDWQHEYISQALAFVRRSYAGREMPVLVTPAGALTATLENELEYTPEGHAAAIQDILKQIDLCLPHGNTHATVLIGVDGRKSGVKSVQTAMWWEHGAGIVEGSIAQKLHPAEGEDLLGTRLSLDATDGDPLLGRKRCVRHWILPLVFHEIEIFGGRSEAAVTNKAIIDRRELLEKLAQSPSVRYVAVLAHSLGLHSAGAFLDGMRKLAAPESDVTVAISGFVDEDDLSAVARRFEPTGKHANKVATLLAENAAGA